MSRDDLDPRLLDKRVVERNIKKGLLSRKDLDKHLKALPDAADKAGTSASVDDDDDDDFDDDEEEDDTDDTVQG